MFIGSEHQAQLTCFRGKTSPFHRVGAVDVICKEETYVRARKRLSIIKGCLLGFTCL